MRGPAAILVVCSAALFNPQIEAREPKRSSHNSLMLVSVQLVPACKISVSVEGLLYGSDVDRLALLPCPVAVSYHTTVPGDPSGAPAVEAVASSDDPTKQYTLSVEF